MNLFLNTLNLNITTLVIPIANSEGGDVTETILTKGERIAFGIIAILFIFLSAWLIWMYFKTKSTNSQLRDSVQDRSAWSFKGYWGRYRGGTLVILTATCFLLGFLLLIASATGTFIISNWHTDAPAPSAVSMLLQRNLSLFF